MAFLADQREWRGVAAPFFGRLAPSTSFPALIARSLDAPLLVCRAKRLSGVRFSLRVEQLAMPRTADRDADVVAATWRHAGGLRDHDQGRSGPMDVGASPMGLKICDSIGKEML